MVTRTRTAALAPNVAQAVNSAPRGRPTRSYAEYFYNLKAKHGFTPAVCVDVGAGFGTTSLYRAFPEALPVAVEPLASAIGRLTEALEPYHSRLVRTALSEKAGKRQLLRLGEASATLLHAGSKSDPRLAAITTHTLDSVMAKVEQDGPVLVKTDCQGGDLDVLKGGPRTLERAEVVVVKASFFRYWSPDQPDFQDILEFMKAQGFVVHDMLEGLFRDYDRALGVVDVAFVREGGPFRAYRHWR